MYPSNNTQPVNFSSGLNLQPTSMPPAPTSSPVNFSAYQSAPAVNLPSTITSASLAPTPKPTYTPASQVPPPPLPPPPTPTAAPTATPAAPAAPAPTDLQSRLDSLYNTYTGKASETATTTAAATMPYQKQLNELNAQIQMHSVNALANQERALHSGDTLGFATGEAAQQQRNDAIEAMRLSAQAQAVQGNLSLASKLAENAVNAKYAQTEKDIQTARQNIINNWDSLTPQEKQRAEATLANLNQNDAFVTQQKANDTAVSQIANSAAQYGADNVTLSAIQKAKTPGEALRIAAQAGLVMPSSGLYTVTSDAYGNPVAFNNRSGAFDQSSPQSNTTGATGSGSTTGYGTATSTVSQITGIDPNTPLSKVDFATLVPAMIQNEGGSPKGVMNNPGNIKYVGLPGQINSGVKAADGGTFASYATPQAGQDAIAANIKSAASKNPSMTLGAFVDRYTNTAPKTSTATFASAGLLAKTDFNAKNQIDQLAQKYLDTYIKNGTVPTATTLGRGIKPGAMGQIDQRARDLFQQATGNPLPNPQLIKGYQAQLIGNNKLLNNLNVQEGTISKNAALLIQNLTANDINNNSPALNSFIDKIKSTYFGDPDIAQFMAQNTTVGNELGSLLSLKNAQGTTVHDKLEAAGIIGSADTPAQITAKVKILLQEAGNAHDAIRQANAELYKQTDPLLQDSNNPTRALEAAFAKQGGSYDHFVALTNPGEQYAGQVPVLDKSSGTLGYINPNEYDPAKYQKI